MRTTMMLLLGLLALGVMCTATTDDCGCSSSPGSRVDELRKCDEETDDGILRAQTEGVEWLCEYWYECVRYDMRECDPCYSLCMAGCRVGCTGLPFWLAILCEASCEGACERCPDCEVCVRWERKKSCGWVFTE
jgi:hypothetical protein